MRQAVSTNPPRPPALIRFRARTRAPMPLESMNAIREIDDDGRASQLYERIGEAVRRCDIQLAMQYHEVEVGKITDGNAELGDTATPFPPKVAGGGVPGDRSALPCYPHLRVAVDRTPAHSHRSTSCYSDSDGALSMRVVDPSAAGSTWMMASDRFET